MRSYSFEDDHLTYFADNNPGQGSSSAGSSTSGGVDQGPPEAEDEENLDGPPEAPADSK